MRRLIAPAALIAVLVLAGCSGPAAAEPSPTPTVSVVANAEAITTLDEGIAYVLAQEAGSMTSNSVLNAAQILRRLAEAEYSASKLGDIPGQLLAISVDAFGVPATDPAPELQGRLAELTKQIRELG